MSRTLNFNVARLPFVLLLSLIVFVIPAKAQATDLYVPAVNVAPCKSQCSGYQNATAACVVLNYDCVCVAQTFPARCIQT
jgi:hypothetical protein